jgi:hypothetical protein
MPHSYEGALRYRPRSSSGDNLGLKGLTEMTCKPEFRHEKMSPAGAVRGLPDMGLLDVTGPQTAFWAASRYMDQRRLPVTGFTM